MGEVKHQLYCAWHIDRAWQKNLNKIRNLDTRDCVYKKLKFLQYYKNENDFCSLLQTTINLLLQEFQTAEFGKYFFNNYGNNYLLWATCFRKQCGINTNMRLESMHKIIKYFYLDGRKVQRLYKGLHALLNYVRRKVVDRIIKNTKGKVTASIHNITTRHRSALTVDTFTVTMINETHFQINNNEGYYEITKKSDRICCPLVCKYCNVCVHSYSCTCTDYFIKNTICKHIHYIVLHTVATQLSLH